MGASSIQIEDFTMTAGGTTATVTWGDLNIVAHGFIISAPDLMNSATLTLTIKAPVIGAESTGATLFNYAAIADNGASYTPVYEKALIGSGSSVVLKTFPLHGTYTFTLTASAAQEFTDGGLEVWTDAYILTNWTKAVAGTSTLNREATVIHGGTYAAGFTIDSSSSVVSIYQTQALAASTGYTLTFYRRANSGTPTMEYFIQDGSANYLQSDGTWGAGAYAFPVTLGTIYALTTKAFTSNAAGTYKIQLQSLSAASKVIYIDDVSLVASTSPTIYVGIVGEK